MSSDTAFLWLRAVIFLGSVFFIGFFSGSETAFIASDRWVIDRLAGEGDKRAAVLKELTERSSDTVSALLIGTNVFTVLASVMASSIAISLGFEEGLSVALVSLGTAAILFMFSELVPKVYASLTPTRVALSVAPYLVVLTRICRPVSLVLSVVPRLLILITRGKDTKNAAPHSDGPIRAALDMAEEDGLVDAEESQVMYSVLDSSDKIVADIMTPMDKAVVIEPQVTLKQAMEVFRRHQFSRIPVLSPDRKKTLGTLYIKDVVRHILRSPEDLTKPCGDFVRKPCIVLYNDNVLDVLSRLRKRKVHLAIVVKDDVPMGLLTLEDLIEEIVGDIPEDSRQRRSISLPRRDGFLSAASTPENSALLD